ncbi:MAG: helicase-related protein [Methanoregula sp.]|nr:helicase-related protein [Methanoregula sp.]
MCERRDIIPKNIKVLWLAQTSLLLDQAAETFDKNIQEIDGREQVTIRVISSSKDHDYAKNISLTDDIVIITTQTAVLQFKPDSIVEDGTSVETALYKFIENAAKDGLFIVLDEAHHAPAYGCRTLLKEIIDLVPNSYLLGLTATPLYNDKTRAGFLPEIFNNWIIYQVDDAKLIAQEILAKPEYEEMETGVEVTITDEEFNNLVIQHREVDDRIIKILSENRGRNDQIVQTYVKNKEKYGKTIIFADRWYQCVYLQTKLEENNVRVNSVFTYIQNDPRMKGVRRDTTENQKIIRDFKNGEYDVLINVRMLTEGADIPDTQTIFVTRQTTSPILFTQMIGRGLRGKKAGGGAKKDHANIVLFIDEWKRLINWITRPPKGGTDETPIIRGYRPIEYIAIDLIKRLSDQISSGTVFNTEPFLRYLPVGWYMVDFSVAVETPGISDELERFYEFVMVYEDDQERFSSFITSVQADPPLNWSHENMSDAIRDDILQYAGTFFDNSQIGDRTKEGIIKIGRHIAQNRDAPEYHDFKERFEYDLDNLVKKFIEKKPREKLYLLMSEFEQPNNLWEIIYRRMERFKTAYDAAENWFIFNEVNGGLPRKIVDDPPEVITNPDIVLTDGERAQVIRRDGHCLCCGVVKKRSSSYELDHIHPFTYGGQTAVENLQTLCQYCNRIKGTDRINFRDVHKSKLPQPKALETLIQKRLSRDKNEDAEFTLRRLINFFYNCAAVSDIQISQRSNGSHYYVWKVEMYQGNKAEWLLAEKDKLIDYLHDCGFDQVTDIEVVACNPT